MDVGLDLQMFLSGNILHIKPKLWLQRGRITEQPVMKIFHHVFKTDPSISFFNFPSVASGVTQTVTLQRHLAPNKSPVHMPITLAPSGTVSAAVPSGGHVTNIAPAPISAAVSKGISTQASGEKLYL